jgi:hypothetical protein
MTLLIDTGQNTPDREGIDFFALYDLRNLLGRDLQHGNSHSRDFLDELMQPLGNAQLQLPRGKPCRSHMVDERESDIAIGLHDDLPRIFPLPNIDSEYIVDADNKFMYLGPSLKINWDSYAKPHGYRFAINIGG